MNTLISIDGLLALQASDTRPVLLDCGFELTDPAAGERAYAAGHLPGALYAHLELELSGPKTKIIPGHGPLADEPRLQGYRTMLDAVRERIRKAVTDGKGLGEVIAAKPTADYDATWGGGFIKPDRWVELIYRGMVSQPRQE